MTTEIENWVYILYIVIYFSVTDDGRSLLDIVQLIP